MKIKIDKELFQWEKGRFVTIELYADDPLVSHIQFYNKKSPFGKEIPLKEGKAQIPDYLLKEDLPIMAVACIGIEGDTKVIARKEFRVIPRVKPEFYEDDEIPEGPDIPEDTDKEVIYDGGEET